MCDSEGIRNELSSLFPTSFTILPFSPFLPCFPSFHIFVYPKPHASKSLQCPKSKKKQLRPLIHSTTHSLPCTLPTITITHLQLNTKHFSCSRRHQSSSPPLPPLIQRRAVARSAPAVFLSATVLALTFSVGVLYGSSVSHPHPPS